MLLILSGSGTVKGGEVGLHQVQVVKEPEAVSWEGALGEC